MLKEPRINISGFAGTVKCPKDYSQVTIYMSGIRIKENGAIKFNYDCADKGDCKKEGFCSFRDSYSDRVKINTVTQ
jgi:hypothetical protein